MAEVSKTLLIEGNQETRNKYAAILEFIGSNKVIDANCETCIDHLKKGDIGTIILGHCDNKELLASTFDEIRETAKDVPIILILSRDDEQQPVKKCYNRFFVLLICH